MKESNGGVKTINKLFYIKKYLQIIIKINYYNLIKI